LFSTNKPTAEATKNISEDEEEGRRVLKSLANMKSKCSSVSSLKRKNPARNLKKV
jgi:hypothetical protein